MFKHSRLIIEQYGDKVIARAQKNLNTTGFANKGRKINSSGDLSKSLYYEILEEDGNLYINFRSDATYAAFIEQGVNGYKRKHGSEFSFKNNGKYPIGDIIQYLKDKNIRLRETVKNKYGQTVSRFVVNNEKNRRKAAFAMATVIKRDGIKPTNFYGDAMNFEFDALPPEIALALTQDLADIIYDDLKRQGKNVKRSGSNS